MNKYEEQYKVIEKKSHDKESSKTKISGLDKRGDTS